ncbi:hypothetical protein ACFL59_12400 [Planctomycetota bacterium]
MGKDEIRRSREALDSALQELEAVLSGRKPATAVRLCKALHAILQVQGVLLRQVEDEKRRKGEVDSPIPPAALQDDDDEPTVFLDDLLGQEEAPETSAETPTPIPPSALADETDEPTLMFMAKAQPGSSPPEEPKAQPSEDREAALPGDLDAAPQAAIALALERFAPSEMQRWIDSGTLFQLRDDMAYVNVRAVANLKFDLRGKMGELGFAKELGLLDSTEVEGNVLLFQRP